MKHIIAWLNDAVSTKGIAGGMNHYCVSAKQISATNGRITASHPWPYEGDFLVPGNEFEKVLDRMPDEPELEIDNECLNIKCGRFRGTVQTLPVNDWNYPGVDDADWHPIPEGLIPLLTALRPFISDNAVQPWALCVALENGWAYASNNIAIAGAPLPTLGSVQALLPSWAIDFVLDRTQDLTHWAWTENYVAFGWDSGAWMRSQLVIGQFPEAAATMVRDARKQNFTQTVTPEFRAAFERIAELAEDTVAIFADRIESCFGRAVIEDGIECEVPEDSDFSLWGAKFLLPALQAAETWSPRVWPKPCPWRGKLLSGWVVGRRV